MFQLRIQYVIKLNKEILKGFYMLMKATDCDIKSVGMKEHIPGYCGKLFSMKKTVSPLLEMNLLYDHLT